MKHFIFFLFFTIPLFAQNYYSLDRTPIDSTSGSTATTYYVSSTGNDGNSGTSENSAWQSLTKVSSFTPIPGDQILFKRGDIFYGSLTVRSNVTYAAYGSGANPKISGYTTLTSWTDEGSGIYSTTLNTDFYLNNVLYNDVLQPMGRTEWKTYTSHSGNTSITDATLTGSWTGAEVVIRKNEYVIDRHAISSGNSTTLTYTTTSNYFTTPGNTTDYSPVDGNGYFIQNSLATLDSSGEWFYDSSTNKLYIYSGTTPTNVKASTIETLLDLSSVSNITFNNIDIEGANSYGVWVDTSNNIVFNDCNISNVGGAFVYGWSNNFEFNGGTLNGSNFNGINIIGNNCTLKNYSCSDVGMNAGMGWGSGEYTAISLKGANNSVINSSVVNTGYIPISFSGTNAVIENNYIDNFCSVKDDGGGIYTYGAAESSAGSKVRNNVILNGIGAPSGTEGNGVSIIAAGIYCDNLSTGIELSGNTIAYCQLGIMLNQANTINVHDNTLYNNTVGLHMTTYTENPTENIVFENNIIAKNTDVDVIVNETNMIKVDNIFTFFNYPTTIFSIGSFDNNYYLSSSNDLSFLFMSRRLYNGASQRNFADWQTYSGNETNSEFLQASTQFEYNATSTIKIVSLNQPMIDVMGNEYSGSIILQPYSSVILKKTN